MHLPPGLRELPLCCWPQFHPPEQDGARPSLEASGESTYSHTHPPFFFSKKSAKPRKEMLVSFDHSMANDFKLISLKQLASLQGSTG